MAQQKSSKPKAKRPATAKTKTARAKTARAKTAPKTGKAAGSKKSELEVSVVMPCLNEEETLGTCIQKAAESLKLNGIKGEIVIADNGSTDNSIAIAKKLGARVVNESKPGYGNAYKAGFGAARGRFIIMGDSDDSYDFSNIMPFVEKLREGFELVMGTRLKGEIRPGAMPWLHRYIGNPVLSWFLNLLFKTGISDSHCGMRGFSREAYSRMNLKTTGMEFASEMVIKSAKAGLKMTEVPITLYPDGRSRRPHLRSFRDGWRHLRFMLMHSPRFLFFIPGLTTIGLGLLLMLGVSLRQSVFGHVLDTNFMLLGSILTVIGLNITSLGFFAHLSSLSAEFDGEQASIARVQSLFHLEKFLFSGVFLFFIGLGIDIFILISWIRLDFGNLDHLVNLSVFGNTLLVLGIQMVFSSFYMGILQVKSRGYE